LARSALTAIFASFSRPNQPGVAQARPITPQDKIDRGSRLWVPLVAFENSADAKAYQDFQERYDFKPLIEIQYRKGANGWEFESLKGGFLFYQQEEGYQRKPKNSTDSGAGNVELPNSVPMPDAARVSGAGAAGASAASGGTASLAVPDSARDARPPTRGSVSEPAPPAGAP
jgi:hypothetical protein